MDTADIPPPTPSAVQLVRYHIYETSCCGFFGPRDMRVAATEIVKPESPLVLQQGLPVLSHPTPSGSLKGSPRPSMIC